MKILKESLIKLLFILPMLAILVASTGIVTFTANSKKQEKSFGHYFVEKNNSNNDVTIIASVDNNSLLLKETEHLEFNFEINWNSIFSFSHHFFHINPWCIDSFSQGIFSGVDDAVNDFQP